MKRRNFIKVTGTAASIPILLNGMKFRVKASPLKNNNKVPVNDKVLVLINLAGGNDGLNTLIPLDQYETLKKVRADILPPESTLLKLSDDLALHSSLSDFKSLYDNEKLCIVQNVGYPLQNQSHFRSTDIWNSGSDSKVYEGSGWLGRLLALQHPDFPGLYPNEDFPDPLAITIGSISSNTLQGEIYDMGMAVAKVDNFQDFLTSGTDTLPDTYAGEELSFIRRLMTQTNEYFSVITDAINKGNNLSDKYPEENENRLADQLKSVAKLISGGLKTQVYVVNLGGFDTHANQVAQDGITGTHAELLSYLSEAVGAFQDDIEKLGIADRVLGMTYSEFGRRIVENASYGTDHGSAAPLFLFGTKVNPLIIGTNPYVDSEVTVRDNLLFENDFRSIYWSVLKDWFELEKTDLETVLFKEHSYLSVIYQNPNSINELELNKNLRIENFYPNPIRALGKIKFYTSNSWLKISIINMQGIELKVLTNQYYSMNNYTLDINTEGLNNGTYILQLQNSTGVVSTNFIVQK